MNNSPEQIFNEYRTGFEYKCSIGSKGLFEQNKINERFFAGDQWYGAKCGNDRPLVRHNIIKRIGDYKMSVLLSNAVSITYSAEGVPNTVGIRDRNRKLKKNLVSGEGFGEIGGEDEISFVMSSLNDYQRVTGERLHFDMIAEQTLRDAYISGTGIVYTYWNPEINTGLYADDAKRVPIKGDISCEALNIEDVYFGDPYSEDVQEQPYIIIATRMNVDDARREALQYGVDSETAGDIVADYEFSDGAKVTVLTKLWKKWNSEGTDYCIMAKRVTKNIVIRDEWDIGIRMYPISKFCWERRKSSAYGDSEITYLIPNQIAVNRMITSGVWSAMSTGMPTMVVNGDAVGGEITNDPGQIIKVYGSDDVANAVKYVAPPDYSGNFSSVIEPLIDNTLAQSGANAAALGDVDPQNTSAIIELRNAAVLPLKILQNRYYNFLEEISRIWAEFWIMQYGKRHIKIEDENGVWYMPFDGERYKNLIISAKAEVGASGTAVSAETGIKTLDKLLDLGAITVKEYLSRLPRGLVSNVSELIKRYEEGEYDSV